MLYRFRCDDGTYYPRGEMQDVISKVCSSGGLCLGAALQRHKLCVNSHVRRVLGQTASPTPACLPLGSWESGAALCGREDVDLLHTLSTKVKPGTFLSLSAFSQDALPVPGDSEAAVSVHCAFQSL